MKKLLRRIVSQSAKDGGNVSPTRLLQQAETYPMYKKLANLMQNFTVSQLVNSDPKAFKQRIDEFLELVDAQAEGYINPSKQRDLSIKFHWGHNHDFGDFQLEGQMRDRHLELITLFTNGFDLSPKSYQGLRILDIGAWTGGVSLLLSALGAEVVAVEEVKKYADTLEYLKTAFDIKTLDVRHMSLYDCDNPEFFDSFDLVFYAGVIYHVTDPILSLRILFNTLKDGGVCFVESATINSAEKIIKYHGPERVFKGTVEKQNRSGWNWFIPSPVTLQQMMYDVGFNEADVAMNYNQQRVFGVAKRHQHIDMLRAGLARPNIR
jgi:2-polyprenyl-3-methyl-5-hydroxy-6-metoxy-1,4-benzoquinol methylase